LLTFFKHIVSPVFFERISATPGKDFQLDPFRSLSYTPKRGPESPQQLKRRVYPLPSLGGISGKRRSDNETA
jgi:hypothetical protein